MKRLIYLFCALLAALLPGAALAQDDAPLVVVAGQHEPGSVATIGRDIRVDGSVDGDVTSWSGAITVAGTVGGDVVSYGGAVTILPTGRVAGHVMASGGALRLAAGAVVAGQAIQGEAGGGTLASLLDLFAPGDGAGVPGGVGRVLFGGTAGALLAAFCLLLLAFWPRRTQIASAALAARPGRALALGALSAAALALALPPLLALLIASVIGLPLVVLVVLLVAAAYAYGLAIVARIGGDWLARRPGARPALGSLPVVAVLALVVPLALLSAAAPLWGALAFQLLALPGLGAAILSRGGTALPA